MLLKGDGQVVLRHRPILRQGLAGIDLQRGAVGAHCLPQQLEPRLPLAADALLLEGDGQVVLRRRPLLRQSLAGRDLQRGAVGADGLPLQRQPRLPLAAAALCLKGGGQVVLRHRPILRQGLAGAHLQRGAVGADGAGEELIARGWIGADAVLLERHSQVVLQHGPGLRVAGAGELRQRGLVGGDGRWVVELVVVRKALAAVVQRGLLGQGGGAGLHGPEPRRLRIPRLPGERGGLWELLLQHQSGGLDGEIVTGERLLDHGEDGGGISLRALCVVGEQLLRAVVGEGLALSTRFLGLLGLGFEQLLEQCLGLCGILLHLRDIARRGGDGLLHHVRLNRLLALPGGKVNARADERDERDPREHGQRAQAALLALQPLHALAPFPAQLVEHGAQLVDAVLRLRDAGAGMPEGGGVVPGGGHGIGLRGIVRRMRGVEEDVAHGFPDAAGIQRLELRVAALPELRMRRGRGEAVAPADELDDTIAPVHMPGEHGADIPMLRAEDLLEVRVIALVIQERGDGAAQGAVLRADSGDEDHRAVAHRRRGMEDSRRVIFMDGMGQVAKGRDREFGASVMAATCHWRLAGR